MEKIYTHDEASIIVEFFEDILVDNGIKLPSPEDDDRDSENDAALYGSVYDNLLTQVEERLISLLERCIPNTIIVPDEFSGTI